MEWRDIVIVQRNERKMEGMEEGKLRSETHSRIVLQRLVDSSKREGGGMNQR